MTDPHKWVICNGRTFAVPVKKMRELSLINYQHVSKKTLNEIILPETTSQNTG